MADVQAPAADPSSAPAASPSDSAVAARDFSRYAEIENARESGKPIPDAPAASTQDNSAATEKKAETAPVPEPGSPQEKNKGGRKPDAESRIQEIIRENKELQAKLAGTGVTPKADPPPAEKKPA